MPQCENMWFFFSIRRRHTSCGRDWSSDVCSSDLGVLGILGTGHRAIGTGTQILLEIADLRIGVLTRLEDNESIWVVVDFVQRLIDLLDALANRLPLEMQLRLEIGDFANRILVQEF